MDPGQFRLNVVRPALSLMMPVYRTQFAEDLLMATCAQETLMCEYLVQIGGPAKSVYQFEEPTFNDLWGNYIIKLGRWDMPIVAVGGDPQWTVSAAFDAIVYNLRFATLCARLNYYRVPAPLPVETTLDNLWGYYKPYWNSFAGAATKAQFATNIKNHTDIVL